MPTHRFPSLVWSDPAGLHTAIPVESDELGTAGFGASASRALEQLRDFLSWLYHRDPYRPPPGLVAAELSVIKVPIRPEYHVGHRIYAGEDTVNLPVHCVAGRLVSGLLVAALPLLDIRFYYHEAESLRGLVHRYAQLRLKGLTPRMLSSFLPPAEVRLEDVVIRVRSRGVAPVVEKLKYLSQVAEPLTDRAVRKQFSAAWERTELVQDVVRRLQHERSNVLLVGDAGAGKSTVLVEAVQAVDRQRAQAAKARREGPSPPAFWLTSAGRLIAGMKYLGQWEERCQHIIDELARVTGVLCVDRLLDLIRLGGGSAADSLAAFFAPYLQRGELRMIGEATPAELDACRRLLPAFADLFAIVQVAPFTRAQALAVLERTADRHAQDLQIEVAPDVSDRVYHLFRRFQPYQAFPGPAVHFVRQLCERQARMSPKRILSAEDVVGQFVNRTGLPEWLLRDEVPLNGEELIADLRRQVIGQEDAIQAAARLVFTFKAGLNDPRRPIGVLLFCGPTGVGKTELAKALARILFGHHQPEAKPTVPTADRLVRFDMSEFASFDAVQRLLGRPGGEAGPLIRRFRQQPFAVLLLDEIEKASPDVFDVLLGLCDEGRLTDRFGRTTTFCSAVIIMTSNLGADRQEGFGLKQTGAAPYADIAREFFRPEFFNRLDGVVTFHPLAPETIHAITRKELAEIGSREGFHRARIRLEWSDRLVELLARTGFDARFGARPLQRVLERRVVAPLARFLLLHPEMCDAVLALDDDGEELQITHRPA